MNKKEEFEKIINEEIKSLNEFIDYCITKEDNKIKEFNYISCLISRRIGLEDLINKIEKIDFTKEEE